jgi:hypothetical protein
MNRIVYIAIMYCTVLWSCKSATEPTPAEDAGVYLPASQGSTWMYQIGGGTPMMRVALADTMIYGNTYHLLRDSMPYQTFDTAGNRIDTFVYASTYLRSDPKGIYDIGKLNPFYEVPEFLADFGSTWTILDTQAVSPKLFIIQDDYYTVTKLPTYTVGDSIYHDVLFVLRHESVPTTPGYGTNDLEIYYAKGIGQIAVRDPKQDKLTLKLLSYHLK